MKNEPAWNLISDLVFALRPDLWVRHFFSPDPWQVAFLADREPRQLACTSRQIGKSTSLGLKLAHRAWFFVEQLILILAPTLRQSVELINKCKWTLAKVDPTGRHHSAKALSIEVGHTGSRIVALPGGNPNNIRGFSAPNIITVDEAAFTRDSLYTDAISPMLMHGGQLILTSTANVKRGYFYDIVSKSDADLGEKWSRHIVPATMSPRATPQFLAAQRKRLPEYRFQAEYMCQFFDSVEGFFRADEVDRAFQSGPAGLFFGEKKIIKPEEYGALPALKMEDA